MQQCKNPLNITICRSHLPTTFSIMTSIFKFFHLSYCNTMFLMCVSQIIPFYNYSQVPENIVHTPDTLFSENDQNKVYHRTSHTLTI